MSLMFPNLADRAEAHKIANLCNRWLGGLNLVEGVDYTYEIKEVKDSPPAESFFTPSINLALVYHFQKESTETFITLKTNKY